MCHFSESKMKNNSFKVLSEQEMQLSTRVIVQRSESMEIR